MTDETKTTPSTNPRAVGFAFAFLAIGLGALQGVGPTELAIRACVMGGVATICTKLFSSLWHYLSDEELEADSRM